MTRLLTGKLAGVALGMIGLWCLPRPATANACAAPCNATLCSGDCTLSPPGSPQLEGVCGDIGSSLGRSCQMNDPALWRGGGIIGCGNSLSAEGWAIVRFHVVPPQSRPRSIKVIRASSDELAEFLKSHMTMVAFGSFTSTSEVLVAAPPGPCEALWALLPFPAPAFEEAGPGGPEVVYFRAVTDGAKHISSFEVLYSETNAAETQRLLAYGKAYLSVWSLHNPTMPVEVYGSLMEVNGSVGYMIEAGSLLRSL
jgi:hypothetical protein